MHAFEPADSGNSISTKESADNRERARAALRSGDFVAALALSEKSAAVTSSNERAAWLVIDAEANFLAKRFAKAGLDGMRVVVMYPQSDQAGAALYWVGRAYEELGRPAKAIELFEASVANKRTPKDIRQATQARIDELRRQEGTRK